MCRSRHRWALPALATFAVVLAPSAALAHGEQHVGDLSVTIGFGTEPAYTGLPNSVQVLLEHDGAPVVDAKDMSVDVTFGDATTTYDLEPDFVVGVFGEAGDYRAFFVPSEPGPYTFHVTGRVGDEDVDVEMTSGQDTFSEVESIADAAFPPVEAPTTEELAGRIDTDSERISAAAADATAAQDEVSSARTLATIGLVVGAIGVLAAIGALAAVRRRSP